MEVAAVPVSTSPRTVVPGEEQSTEAVPDLLLPSSSTPEQAHELASEGKDDVESAATEAKLPILFEDEDALSRHLVVRPMYQIFSITISCHDSQDLIYPYMYKIKSLSDGRPCEVFGLVRLFVEGGKTFDIYNRAKHNPQIVNLGGLLNINSFPIVHTKRIKVAVYLFDSAHDVEIANGTFIVDYRYIEDYDEVQVEGVKGEYGLACIHSATFQHGVVANIERIILREASEVGRGAHSDLVGTISARLKKPCKYSISDHENKFPSIILFDSEMLTQEMKFVQFGSHINLSTTCVVVPASFYLTISANFKNHNGDENVCIDFELKARHEGLVEMRGKGVNCEMELKVKWCYGYAEEECMEDVEPTQQSLQFFQGAEQSSTEIASAITMVFPCVEVFSVVVYVDESVDTSAISGKIMINDSSRIFCIFEGQDIAFDEIKSLTLKSSPCSFDDEPFCFFINLVDDKKRIVSKGVFEWNCGYNESHMLYNDKLLCSIIEGDIGYAAIHYSMITYGVQAKIQVSVLSKSLTNFCVSVYGRITAKYGSYDYSCVYDETYYQSIVFSRPKDDLVTLDVGLTTTNHNLPLTRPLISVPLEDLLIVEVDLMVIGSLGEVGRVEKIEERLEFETNVSNSCNIGREDYVINVTTLWSDIRYFPNEREEGVEESREVEPAA